jgi:hypothetical protein
MGWIPGNRTEFQASPMNLRTTRDRHIPGRKNLGLQPLTGATEGSPSFTPRHRSWRRKPPIPEATCQYNSDGAAQYHRCSGIWIQSDRIPADSALGDRRCYKTRRQFGRDANRSLRIGASSITDASCEPFPEPPDGRPGRLDQQLAVIAADVEPEEVETLAEVDDFRLVLVEGQPSRMSRPRTGPRRRYAVAS